MTIELTTEEVTEAMEQAARYGACSLKTKTTNGDDVWVVVQSRKQRTRQPRAIPTEPAAGAA